MLSGLNAVDEDLEEEKRPLKRFVESPEFQYAILFFVILGGIIAGIQESSLSQLCPSGT